MSERNKHIDELFRQTMDGHTEDPPPHVWDKIESGLNNMPKKAPVRIWWFWSIVGIMLISTTALVANYSTNEQNNLVEKNTQEMLIDKTAAVGTKQQLKRNVLESETETHEVEPKQQQIIANAHSDKSLQKSSSKSVNNNLKPNTSTLSKITEVKSPQQIREKKPIARLRQNKYRKIIQSEIVASANKNSVVNKTPKIKEEPYYLAAKKVVPRNIAINDAKVSPTQPIKLAPEISKPVQPTAGASNTLIAPKLSNANGSSLLASNKNMLLTDNTLPQAQIPAPLNTENAEGNNMHVPQSAPTSYHDTTKKKKRKKVRDTTSTEQDDILNQSSEPELTDIKHPLPIEFGIKAGYSFGTNSEWSANKIVIAPYASYRVSDKFSIVFQPAYQTGNPRTGNLANANSSYYEVTNQSFDSTSRIARGHVDSSILTPNPPDSIFRSYTYTQSYDSVHVQYGVENKQLWDIELPLLLKYKVHKNISVLAGVSATYSSAIQTKEVVSRYNMTQSHTDDYAPATFFVTAPNQPLPQAPTPKAYEDVFSHSGTPLSSFEPRTITNTKNFFRYGYMLGVSANYKERWMLDLLWHQTGVDVTQVSDKNLQKIYKQPYIRVTIGYKLSK